MKCLMFVKFLPDGSITPDVFFSHLHAEWGWYDEDTDEFVPGENIDGQRPGVRSAVCLADYDSIQQLAIDLSIMPGAGIGAIEVIPVPDPLPNDEYLNNIEEASMYN